MEHSVLMSAPDFPEGYELQRELGEGSMGRVWLARSKQNGCHCAVKVLSLRNDRRGSAERSFNREVRAMARLDHPSIIQVHDFGRTPKGSPFVAMEYVSGAALNGYMRSEWTWPRLWGLVDGLLEGLGHAHARELVHRDLKPGNVIVLPDRVGTGAIKLADFGIALAITDAKTVDRRIEGTPAYIAPEAASGNVAQVGPWTDLYALGIMLFEILTGDLPYHGRHLLAHHQRSPLPPVVIRDNVEVPPGIVEIVIKLLAKSPADRYRSVASLRADFEELGLPPTSEPLGPSPFIAGLEDDYPEEAMTLEPLKGPAGPGLFHIRQPALVGRDGPKDQLWTAAQAVLDGRGPRVVLIEGDAGSGKSRLTSWLREQLEESGRMTTLVVRSEPHSYSGGGLREAVLRFLGAPGVEREDADAALSTSLADDDERREMIDLLWSESPHAGPVSDAHIKRAAQLVHYLARDSPFFFWVEDAHWSPEGKSLRLIHRLARPDGPSNLLIVATLRASERSTVKAAKRDLLKLPSAEFVKLGALSPLELAPALESLAPLPPGVAEAASMIAAGNPLIALEAVRSFLEDEGLGSAPSDPKTVLKKRIERATHGDLGGELRSAMSRATLLGRSFSLRPLCRLCAVKGDPSAPHLSGEVDVVEALLERAENAGLIVEQNARRWRFSHDLIRAELRKACRELANWQALNKAAAELRGKRAESDPTGIELEVVARHHWEAEEKAKALHLGLRGLNQLHSSGLMGHATSFARRLLRWNEECRMLSAPDEGELCLLASVAAEHAGQPVEAEEHAQAAIKVARSNDLSALGARAAGRMGVLKLQHDDPSAAEQWLWDALRFARESGDPRALSDVNLSLGYFYQRLSRYDLAYTAYEVSFESALGHQLVESELAARSALAGLERLQNDLARAEQTFQTIADRALEESLEVAALSARLQLGLCAWNRADPETALRAFEDVRRGARGNLFTLEFYACLGAAWAYCAQKQWGEAELCLMHAGDLRYDVRLRDPEAEKLRLSARDLAVEHRRIDIVEHIDKLDVLRTRTSSTQHSL